MDAVKAQSSHGSVGHIATVCKKAMQNGRESAEEREGKSSSVEKKKKTNAYRLTDFASAPPSRPVATLSDTHQGVKRGKQGRGGGEEVGG